MKAFAYYKSVEVLLVRVNKQFLGGCVCAFGVGVVFSAFLPVGVMLIIEGVLVVGAGALALCR